MYIQKYPLVSIRIPLYNHELYIEKCLDSVYNDSYPNKEIVIINDGSTDNSKCIVENWISRYEEKIPIYFFSRENKGVTKTLNELNLLCRGEYIVGLASDDYLLNDSILKRIDFMSEKQCDVLFADCMVVSEKNELLHKSALRELYKVNIENYRNQKILKEEIIINWSLPGSTLMVHRSVYNEYKYDEKSIVEDYDFFLYVVAKKKLCYYDEIVAAYRQHSMNSHLTGSYILRQKSMIRSLVRNFVNFSFRLQLKILKKMYWIFKKTIKNYIKGRR